MSIVKRINEYTGEIELEIQGKLKSSGSAVMLTKNSLKRPYRLAQVEVTYPDRSIGIVDCLLFESMRKEYSQYFEIDSAVILKVFTQGEKKGYSQILPPKTNLISYKKLPSIIQTNLLWVGDEYRTNILSLLPGGFCIIIEYCDGSVFGYDKIKFKEIYIQKILLDYFRESSIEFEELSSEEKKEILKIYISSIYFREFSNSNDYENSDYDLLWSNKNTEFLPWE